MQITMQFKLFDATMHKNAKKKIKNQKSRFKSKKSDLNRKKI